MTMPADPDGMNEQRASWARIAVQSFGRQTGQDIRTDGLGEMLSDLLTNMIHLCDREQIQFRDVYVRSVLAYQAETAMPLPFALVDRLPVEDFQPDQPPVILGQYPNETAAWLTLQDLPEAETGRYRIEKAP